MPSKTSRGRGRAIRMASAADVFPTPEYVRTHLTPERGHAGLREFLQQLGYSTDDAEEAAVASHLGVTAGSAVAPALVNSTDATATVNVSACRLRKIAAMESGHVAHRGFGASQGRHPNIDFGRSQPGFPTKTT